jgi:hypothetical protein
MSFDISRFSYLSLVAYSFVSVRVISWIVRLSAKQTIHELNTAPRNEIREMTYEKSEMAIL